MTSEPEGNRTTALAPLGGEGGEPVRPSAANGPERSEGAQGELDEPGEGAYPAIAEIENFTWQMANFKWQLLKFHES
jgi:hypothetical protein